MVRVVKLRDTYGVFSEAYSIAEMHMSVDDFQTATSLLKEAPIMLGMQALSLDSPCRRSLPALLAGAPRNLLTLINNFSFTEPAGNLGDAAVLQAGSDRHRYQATVD